MKRLEKTRRRISLLKAKKPEIVFMFDFDATLIRTLGPQSKLAARLISKHFKISPNEARKIYFLKKDIPFQNKLEDSFPGASKERIKICAKEYAEKKVKLLKKVGLFPDVHETLAKLKDHTIVASSGNDEDLVERVLKEKKISGFFTRVYGRSHGTKKEHIKKVREEFNPKLIVFTGDSQVDMKLADYDVLIVGRAGEKEDGLFTVDELLHSGADLATPNLKRLASPGRIRGTLLMRYAKELSKFGKKKAFTLFIKKRREK